MSTPPPTLFPDLRLPTIAALLRDGEAQWRSAGVSRVRVFGSVARGEAKLDSDIDLIAEFAPEARLSLTGLASLRADLAGLLGASVDLAEWAILKPPVREQAERDAVQVF